MPKLCPPTIEDLTQALEIVKRPALTLLESPLGNGSGTSVTLSLLPRNGRPGSVVYGKIGQVTDTTEQIEERNARLSRRRPSRAVSLLGRWRRGKYGEFCTGEAWEGDAYVCCMGSTPLVDHTIAMALLDVITSRNPVTRLLLMAVGLQKAD